MIIAALLIICAIVFILALLYILGCLASKHVLSRRKKYQEHIDNLVDELFSPDGETPSVQTPSVQTPTVNTSTSVQTSTQTPTVYESDLQYQEAKRNMVANIRTYFNQHKINAAIASVQGSKAFVSVNQFSRSYSKQTFPSPPSLQRLLE